MSTIDRDDIQQFQPMPTEVRDYRPTRTRRRAAPAAVDPLASPILDAEAVARQDEITRRISNDVMSAQVVTRSAPTSPAPPAQHETAPGLDAAGELGAAVAEVTRLDRVESTARKVRSRIEDEAADIAKRQTTAIDDHTATLLDEVWEDAAAKRRVGEFVERSMHFIEHGRAETSAQYEAARLVSAVNARMVDEAGQRVRDTLDDVNVLVLDAARGALTKAVEAHTRLELAGLTVDATDRELVVLRDAGALAAIALWHEAVSGWVEVQAVRAWVAAVRDRGFRSDGGGRLALTPPPRVRSGAYAERADNDTTAEQRTQGSVWVGVSGQGSMAGVAPTDAAHSALRWWCHLAEAKRPAPRGVSSSTNTSTSSRRVRA